MGATEISGADPKTGRTSSGRAPSASTLQKAMEARQQRRIFNNYLKNMGGKTVTKLARINEELERGTRIKRVPLFENGRRTGSVEKEVPLLPSDRARLLVLKRQIETDSRTATSAALREEFLQVLPTYASRNGYDRAILLEVGVPLEDLDVVGIV